MGMSISLFSSVALRSFSDHSYWISVHLCRECPAGWSCGIMEAQISTEVEVTARHVDYLRGNLHGYEFGNIIGVGHSFGRYILDLFCAS
jgi:hypothetical protein